MIGPCRDAAFCVPGSSTGDKIAGATGICRNTPRRAEALTPLKDQHDPALPGRRFLRAWIEHRRQDRRRYRDLP
jgi:hypothetical protein